MAISNESDQTRHDPKTVFQIVTMTMEVKNRNLYYPTGANPARASFEEKKDPDDDE